MGPHLIWAGVVLAVAWMGYLANRRYMVRTQEVTDALNEARAARSMAASLVPFKAQVIDLEGANRAINARLEELSAKLARQEQIINALSAVPKGGPPVRRI